MENVSPIELLAEAGDDVGEAFESFMRIAFMNVMPDIGLPEWLYAGSLHQLQFMTTKTQ